MNVPHQLIYHKGKRSNTQLQQVTRGYNIVAKGKGRDLRFHTLYKSSIRDGPMANGPMKGWTNERIDRTEKKIFS